MNTYQQKWITVLNNAALPGWEIKEIDNDIMVVMPHISDLKVIRDNLPDIIARLSLDIDEPKQRLRFIIKNGYEEFDYIINPGQHDLEG